MYINKGKKSISGFTLLEIIIAMLILSIVTAGTWGLLITNYKFVANAMCRLQAVNRASALLEQMRWFVSAIPDYPIGAGTVFTEGIHPSSEISSIIGLEEYPAIDGSRETQWNYSVSSIAGADCRSVTVTMRWDEV